MTETRLDITIAVRLKELQLREHEVEAEMATLRDVLQDLFIRRWHVQHDDLKVHVKQAARRTGSDSSPGHDLPRSEDAGALRLTRRTTGDAS